MTKPNEWIEDYDPKVDPMFHADAMFGVVLNALAVIGLFSLFVTACFFVGYLA